MSREIDHHLIYDAVLSDAAFHALPSHLAKVADARSCWMLWQSPDEVFSVCCHSGPWDAAELDQYAREGAPRDPLIAASRKPGVINRLDRASRVLGQEAFLNSEFYNEQIRAAGSGTYWIAGTSFDTPQGLGTVGIHRDKSAGDFTDEEIARLGAANDDIRRMLVLRCELATARLPANLDFPLRAAFRMDRQGRILTIDAAGERLLRHHPLMTYEDGLLRLAGIAGLALTTRLQRATRQKAPKADILRLASPAPRDVPDLQLNIIPDLHRPGEAIVMVVQASSEAPIDVSEGPPELTLRESEILHLLVSGERRDRIAYRLGISVPTVDLHLGKLRRKLDASTLPEMVAQAVRRGLA